MPDYRPDKNTPEQIRSKSSVLYFPLDLPPQISSSCQQHTDSQTHHSKKLRILYNGRWEHDKNPQLFFSVIRKVCLTIGDIQSGEQLEDWGEENEGKSDMEKDIDINDQEIGDNSKNIKDKINHSNSFELCILGQAYGETPPVFTKAHRLFQRHIIQWGRLESRSDYFRMMSTCDVVVSTADHEFFGVAIIEAMSQGCFPIVPNRLAYPEVLNIEGLQSDEKILDSEKQPSKGKDNKKNFCGDPIHAISNEDRILAIQQSNRFSTEQLKGQYLHDILEIDSRTILFMFVEQVVDLEENMIKKMKMKIKMDFGIHLKKIISE
ncbi:MAG: putative glycosyl transferase family 1 [Streblomastix strix]|uniref:Putative glycosyl transferase family 1 n=1 Tax=Streblomastix strix TaxID=222440 RepID=A0A5J4W8A9_9EUKA|nr:MAG: putative glycosyl transferase family 1 [Streblomastix strix]